MKRHVKLLSALVVICLLVPLFGVSLAEEQITLTFTHFFLEADRENNSEVDVMLGLIDRFVQEHPNVTLEQNPMAQVDMANKLQAQAAAGDMPDLFLVKGSWVNNFLKNDVLMDLTPALDAYDKRDTYRDGIFNASERDGKIYAVPFQLGVTSVVFWNEAMWKEIGYDEFPTTWEDLMAAGEKFAEKGIPTFAIGNKDMWPAESCILSALGDRYTGAEWTNSIIANDGAAKFTDQPFVDALARLQSMVPLFNVDYNTIQNNQGDDYYCMGEAAAMISGHWVVSYIQSNAAEDVLANTRVALLPAVEGGAGEAQSTSAGCGWYLGANSKLTGARAEAAQQALLMFGGYDYSYDFATKYGMSGPNIIADVDLSAFPQLTQDFVGLMSHTANTPIYDILMDGAVIDVMNTGLQTLLNGEIEPAALAADIQAAQDKLS